MTGERSALVAMVWVSGCSCAIDHGVPLDAWEPDGGPGTECVSPASLWGELAIPAWPSGACVSMADGDPLCAATLAAYSPVGGAVVASCSYGACSTGSRCSHRMSALFQCQCGGTECGNGQLCINDGSGERCVDICLRERTRGRSCPPLSRAVPSVENSYGTPAAEADKPRSCRLYAQGFSPPGTHALSTLGAWCDGTLTCRMGDFCAAGDTTSGCAPRCTCGGSTCMPTEVCVIDEDCAAATDASVLDAGADSETGPAADAGIGCVPRCVAACWPSE